MMLLPLPRMTETAVATQSHSLGMRMQKKLLGKMASKSVARHFIDDDAGKVLDTLSSFLKEHLPEDEARKIIKNIIKIIIKMGILYSNEKFAPNEKLLLKQMMKKFSKLIMTLVTFWEVAFSFDEKHFKAQLEDIEAIIIQIIQSHLTEKSEKRVRYVFGHFSESSLLSALFRNQNHPNHLDTLAPLLRDYVFGKDPPASSL